MWGLFTVKAGATCAWHSWVTCNGQTVTSTTNTQQTAHVMFSWTSIRGEREREKDSARSSSILSTQTPDTPPFPSPSTHSPSPTSPQPETWPSYLLFAYKLVSAYFFSVRIFSNGFLPQTSRVGVGHGLDIGQETQWDTVGYVKDCWICNFELWSDIKPSNRPGNGQCEKSMLVTKIVKFIISLLEKEFL